MTFTPVALGGTSYLSDCGRYTVRGCFTPDGYTWRGTHLDSDKLVASSHDRGFVEGCCARHAASAIAEAT